MPRPFRGARPRGRGAPSLLTLVLMLAVAAYTWWEKRPQRTEGRVLRVQDGDSFVMTRDGAEQVVRLFAIDAPENDQAFGPEARRFLRDAAKGEAVRLEVRNTDRYGRLVSQVFLPDGRCLNHELVKAGLAWWYRSHSPSDATLRSLEESARKARRGLWSDERPVPPWEFRNDARGAGNGPKPRTR